MRTLRLSSYYTQLAEFNGVCLVTNIDDIFRHLAIEKVNEVIVNIEEMLTIVIWVLANIGEIRGLDANYDKSKWTALKVIREGKIDKFLGVKLILEE